jgi:hypothetical protein
MSFTLSQGFIEKIVIVVLTALLARLIVPYVLKLVDEAKHKRQKKFEADLARQGKIIEAQSELIDDITKTLWEWRYLSIKVSYYGVERKKSLYAAAQKDYEARIWDVLSALRFQITKSRRLVSEDSYKILVDLYDQLVEIDAHGTPTADPEQKIDEFLKLNKLLRWKMTEKLDEVVDILAKDVRLKREKSPEGQ